MNHRVPFIALLPAILLAGCGGEELDDGPGAAESAVVSARRVALRYAVGSVVVVDVDDGPGQKVVDIHYKAPSGSWIDKSAKLLRTANQGHQLYYVDDLPTSSEAQGNVTLQFAIRYRVDGKEYWDNNGTKDYRSQTSERYSDRCELLACEYHADGSRTCVNQYCRLDGTPEPGAGVCQPRPANCGDGTRPLLAPMGPGVDVVLTDTNIAAHMGEIQFGMLVRDVASKKKVSVVFRSDNGATQNMVAQYREGKDSGEKWWVPNGRLTLAFQNKVFFHVEVEQAGKTRRYDNFGKDFECRGSSLELECSAIDVPKRASWE